MSKIEDLEDRFNALVRLSNAMQKEIEQLKKEEKEPELKPTFAFTRGCRPSPCNGLFANLHFLLLQTHRR